MHTIYKTTTYGVMHMLVAFAVAYALTGNWKLAGGIAIVEPIVQTFCYTLHEWAWTRKLTPVRLMHTHGGHAGLIN
jgi:uncharacterized membrane protein